MFVFETLFFGGLELVSRLKIKWSGMVNDIHSRVTEIVNADLTLV